MYMHLMNAEVRKFSDYRKFLFPQQHCSSLLKILLSHDMCDGVTPYYMSVTS